VLPGHIFIFQTRKVQFSIGYCIYALVLCLLKYVFFLLKLYKLFISHFRLAYHMPDESCLWSDKSIYENTKYGVPLCTLPNLSLNKSVDPNVLLSTQPENPVCASMIPLSLGDHVLQKWKKTRQNYIFPCTFICTFSNIVWLIFWIEWC